VESRRGRHSRLSSTTGSEYQQSASGEAGARMACADTGVTTVGGTGFGWGSGKGKSLPSAPQGGDVLDPPTDSGAGARGEGGGLGAGQLAIKAAMRFKGRARKRGGGGGGGSSSSEEATDLASLGSHGAQSVHRRLSAGSEVNSKGGRSADHLSRLPSHVEVRCSGPPKASCGCCDEARLWLLCFGGPRLR
jgi:hypothetical protein